MNIRRANRIKRGLEMSGNLRDFRYVKALKEKNRLYLRGKNLNEPKHAALFEDFRLFVKQTEEIYGGTWDFKFSINTVGDPTKPTIAIVIDSIILRYENLTIANSSRRSHNIRELLVRIKLAITERNKVIRLCIGDIFGNRLVMTKPELQSNYWHSHLSGDVTRNMRNSVDDTWQTFCTGSGEINAYRMELNGDGMTEEKIIAFLLQLTTLVSYESIEGGPYRYIKNIMSKNDNILQPNICTISKSSLESYYNNWILDHKKELKTPNLQFELTESGYLVKDVDALDKVFKVLGEIGESAQRNYYCLKDEQGVCFKIINSNNGYSVPDTSRRTYIFRGEVLRSQIINEQGEALKRSQVSEYVVKPELRKFLINKINNEINKKAVRQSTINRYQNQG